MVLNKQLYTDSSHASKLAKPYIYGIYDFANSSSIQFYTASYSFTVPVPVHTVYFIL